METLNRLLFCITLQSRGLPTYRSCWIELTSSAKFGCRYSVSRIQLIVIVGIRWGGTTLIWCFYICSYWVERNELSEPNTRIICVNLKPCGWFMRWYLVQQSDCNVSMPNRDIRLRVQYSESDQVLTRNILHKCNSSTFASVLWRVFNF